MALLFFGSRYSKLSVWRILLVFFLAAMLTACDDGNGANSDTTYIITASAGSNGSISPSGNVTVRSGSDQTFAITPDGGYSVADVLVDGVSVGAVTTYMFVDVTANHTIAATFVVIPPDVNTNPVITEGASTSVNMDEDGSPTAFSLTLHATDADGDTLTWSVSSAATNGTATASGTGASKAIGYTPNTDYNGSDSFVVQVADGNGGTDTITVNVTIAAVNDAPVISGTPSTSVNEDTAYSFTPTADDVDTGDTLTFSIANQPSWANFDTGTGALTGTPTHADVGTYSNIIITVTDNGVGNLSDSLAAFSIEVVDNVAPTVNAGSEVPLSGATDVSPDSTISATFSEALAPGSVSVTSFTLVKTSDSSSVAGTVGLTNNDTIATFTPSSILEYGTQYTATLTTAITDVAGNPLASDVVWSFTTILKYATQINKLWAWGDGQTDDRFGASVAISGDYAIVGADGEDSGGSNAGAVYIFDNTWLGYKKLVAPDAQADDRFGASVAISGEYIIIGAPGEDSGGSNAGAVYIFTRTSTNIWGNSIKIVSSSGAAADNWFGHPVAINGDYVIVGESGSDTMGVDAGAAHIFMRTGTNTWNSGMKITASDAEEDDLFGFSVAISGDYAIVGAIWEDSGGSNAGAAYIIK